MMGGRIERLRFTLNDTDLGEAVDLLGDFGPDVLHQNAWDILSTEVARRKHGHPPQDIQMMSGVFETLPSVVQAFLDNHRRRESRRAA